MKRMMNLISLGLVVASLLVAEVFSPVPERAHNQKEDVILKKGDRVVVVETYDDQDGQHNTKVSISPEKKQDFSSSTPSGKPGLEDLECDSSCGEKHVPEEGRCDALGRCRHKIERVASDVVSHEKEKVNEVGKQAVDMAKKVVHEAQEMASRKSHEAKEVMEDVYEKGKEAMAVKAREIKESAKVSIDKAKERAKTAKDTGKTIGKDVARDLSKQMEETKESVEAKAREKTEVVKNNVGAFLRNAVERVFSPEGINSLMRVINLLGLGMAYGMCIWVTFVSSYVLAGALPRQQFTVVQSKVYPVYFRAMACAIVVALMGHVFRHGRKLLNSKAGIFQAYNLLGAICLVLFNAVYLEPLATKVMYYRMKLEKEEGRRRSDLPSAAATTTTQAENVGAVPENPEREELRRRFGRTSERLKKLNSYSALLNIVTLMGLTWHLVYLAQLLHVPC